MRVFITGATGFIGTAVVRELLANGHEVVGLARSEASGQALINLGATVHRGRLEDRDSLRKGAEAADGVIHLAFYHQFSHLSRSAKLRVLFKGSPSGIGLRFMEAAVRTDQEAIGTLASALGKADRPLIIVSGTLGLTPGRIGTEEMRYDPTAFGGMRSQTETVVLQLASQGVRSIVMRLPPTVHGQGDEFNGFLPALIRLARKKGFSAYVEDGSNRWPAVHRLDAARLFRLALEKAPAGSCVHGVAEEGVPFRDIATMIGNQLNLPIKRIPKDKARSHFGFLGPIVMADNPTSSQLTQQRFHWQPTQPDVLTDLKLGHYFGN